jgi:hypothetical protein
MLKQILLPVYCVILSMGQTFALTEAELEPSAIKGKTLKCVIKSASAPFATTGSWTGKFETSPAGGFTVANVTGDTVASNATQTFDSSFFNRSYTVFYYKISSFAPGVPAATLTLWIWKGDDQYGNYDLRPDNPEIGGASYGSFTLEGGSVPDIEIREGRLGRGNILKDGSTVRFPSLSDPRIQSSKTFRIKNTGLAKLKFSRIILSEGSTSSFKLRKSPNLNTSLAPGQTATLTVTFDPRAARSKRAVIYVFSNDPDESRFVIRLGVRSR